VADRLRALTGAADILGRYGGEEFALIVPDTTDAGGYAERLRAAVAGAPVPAGGAAVPVTISVGVSYHRAGDDLDALFGRADGALYRSKADGRNRVTVA
jgi:diguanylate cyclase (GGDEF)-like protein